MKKRQFPRKPSVAVTTKAGLNKLSALFVLAIFGNHPTFRGLAPKRWLGPKTTTWRKHRTEDRLVPAGHTRY